MKLLVLTLASLCLISCASKTKVAKNKSVCESFDHYILMDQNPKLKLNKIEEIPYDCRYQGVLLDEHGKKVGLIKILPARSIAGVVKDVYQTYYLYERKNSDLNVERAEFSDLFEGMDSYTQKSKLYIKNYPIKGNPRLVEKVALLQVKDLDIFISLRTTRAKNQTDTNFKAFVAGMRVESKN